MSDGKIHIPARRKQPVDDQMVVKVTPEAYNALVEIYNESTLSLKQIASLLIVKIYMNRSTPNTYRSKRTDSLSRSQKQLLTRVVKIWRM